MFGVQCTLVFISYDNSFLYVLWVKIEHVIVSTALVVITTMAGYGVAPDPFHVGTFLLCTVGTTFTSSAANAVNQVGLRIF